MTPNKNTHITRGAFSVLFLSFALGCAPAGFASDGGETGTGETGEGETEPPCESTGGQQPLEWQDVVCTAGGVCSGDLDGELVLGITPELVDGQTSEGLWIELGPSECAPPDWPLVTCWQIGEATTCGGLVGDLFAVAKDPCDEPGDGLGTVDIRGLIVTSADFL